MCTRMRFGYAIAAVARLGEIRQNRFTDNVRNARADTGRIEQLVSRFYHYFFILFFLSVVVVAASPANGQPTASPLVSDDDARPELYTTRIYIYIIHIIIYVHNIPRNNNHIIYGRSETRWA